MEEFKENENSTNKEYKKYTGLTYMHSRKQSASYSALSAI
jgi:hypothetical protein